MNAAASAEYRAAWARRQAGDEAAYLSVMKEIARKYPESRAGQRAREELASAAAQKDGRGGGMAPLATAAVGGVAAAVAIPAFMKYMERSRAVAASHPVAGGSRMMPAVPPPPTKPASVKRGWAPLK
jgi:hypothetical protein